MPQLIPHIDQICRDKGRDVLFIEFDREVFENYEWETWEVRKELIAWFAENNITTLDCADIANENVFEAYRGQMYIDVPYDEGHLDYIKVRDHLENTDGSFRIPGVIFCCLSYDFSMKNQHHEKLEWDD